VQELTFPDRDGPADQGHPLSRDPHADDAAAAGRLLAHERHHIRQYTRWGPFFIPVYLVLAIGFGYRRHPMERAARRAAGEDESVERQR